LAPKNKRTRRDAEALGRFLRGALEEGLNQEDVARATGRSTLRWLVDSLPEELRAEKMRRAGRLNAAERTAAASSGQAAEPYQNVHLVPNYLLEHTHDIVTLSQNGLTDRQIAEH
jgi:hypothetical protein